MDNFRGCRAQSHYIDKLLLLPTGSLSHPYTFFVPTYMQRVTNADSKRKLNRLGNHATRCKLAPRVTPVQLASHM
jgi:hypothetical protein